IPPGPDPYPGTRLLVMRVLLEGAQFAAMAGLVAWLVLRPLARRSEIGFDGLFVLAALALNFWDPMDNYRFFAFQYNAHFVNVASWGDQIPGFASSGRAWVVPVFFVFGAYTWAFYAASRIGCGVATLVGRRWPGTGL